jgi:hypothetical protein
VYQFSEIIDADLLFYCNHTQVYLKNFLPVSLDIVGNVSLIAGSNGTYLNAPLCFGSESISHTLPANSFATVGRVSVAFCPKSTLRAVALRLQFSVMNETGFPINFQIDSPPFDLIVGNSQSLNSGSSDATLLAKYIAGNNSLQTYRYYLSSATPCNRTAFQFTAQLSCVLANGSVATETPFYAASQTQRFAALSARGTIARACSFNVSEWTFMLAGTCSIYTSIPTFSGIHLYSASFLVVSGNPATVKIVGAIATQLEEAAIIWSTNHTGLRCFTLVLLDEFSNIVVKCQNSFVVFALELNGTERSSYSLYGSTKGVSDCNGTISWCSTRATRSGSINIGVSSAFFNTTIPIVISISGQGPAAQIAVLSPILANSSAMQGGNTLPPVTITLMNAVGTSVAGKSNLIIRIRVIPILQNRYEQCFLLFVAVL